VTGAELASAKRALSRAAARHGGQFTIGRTTARSAPRLGVRYAGARRVLELWRGFSGKASTIERELQQHAYAHYPARIANQRLGGGQQAPDAEHVVYVVLHGTCAPEAAPVELGASEGRRAVVHFGRRTSCTRSKARS
jgi:hypothetical protein